jgi:hypothetical protein
MFTLKIKTDNEAFNSQTEGEYLEIARILTVTAMRVNGGNLEGRCLDINGNSVGEFKFKRSK